MRMLDCHLSIEDELVSPSLSRSLRSIMDLVPVRGWKPAGQFQLWFMSAQRKVGILSILFGIIAIKLINALVGDVGVPAPTGVKKRKHTCIIKKAPI